jgi:thiamine-monophosphate kinase
MSDKAPGGPDVGTSAAGTSATDISTSGTLASHGEAGLLARILPRLPQGPAVEVGPGDDAAVVRLPSDRLVVTTDTLVEGHDFLPGTSHPLWIGHKAAVQNLADVAAMGARPLALVVSVSAPEETPPSVFEQLSTALAERAGADGASIVGGDLGRAPQLTITVTAMGALVPGDAPILRSGARPGDVLTIGTEQLGRSAAGLALVLAGKVRVAEDRSTRGRPRPLLRDLEDPLAAEVVTWHNAPEPDLTLGWTSGRAATAMMDLSDGLGRDGSRIAAASGVGLHLDRAALEPDAQQLEPLAAALDQDPWQWVLHGGEEHALLATFPPDRVPAGFRPIGTVHAPLDHRSPQITLDGVPLPGDGWDHFA